MRGFHGLLAGAAFVLISILNFGLKAEDQELQDWESNQLDMLIGYTDRYIESRSMHDAIESSGGHLSNLIDPSSPDPRRDIDDLFGDNPVNRPISLGTNSYFPLPSTNLNRGATYLIALETLYQTLQFYGVKHVVERTDFGVEFKVIESPNGVFKKLNKIDVAYALREFSRFLTAHFCNDPSPQNIYRAFSQVAPEEIGMRFKYWMAFALLGNTLPRQPNEILKVGTRWASLSRILNGTRSLGMGSAGSPFQPNESRELLRWIGVMGDVSNLLTQFSGLMCYVDIRPNPKEEIMLRSVVKSLIKMQVDFENRYGPLQELLNQAEREGLNLQIKTLREAP